MLPGFKGGIVPEQDRHNNLGHMFYKVEEDAVKSNPLPVRTSNRKNIYLL